MIPDQVHQVLQRHGLKVLEFTPGSTATADRAARQLHVAVGQIVKSLLFVVKDGVTVMVLCGGDRKVSSAKLKAVLGSKARMARPEETLAATGFLPGGVCPFGLPAGVRVLVDAALAQHATVYPAAGTDGSGVPVTFAQLVAVTGGEVGDYAGPVNEAG